MVAETVPPKTTAVLLSLILHILRFTAKVTPPEQCPGTWKPLAMCTVRCDIWTLARKVRLKLSDMDKITLDKNRHLDGETT